VRFTTLEKRPVESSRLRLSSLVLVQRGEKVAESERLPESPLYVGDTLLYPNLGTPFKRGHDTELAFYLIVYLPESPEDVSANLELLTNARPIARVPLPLDKPDTQRRIQQVSRIPIDQLSAGTYELRIVVRQGHTAVSQTARFRVAE
jgi:hypothetical protein